MSQTLIPPMIAPATTRITLTKPSSSKRKTRAERRRERERSRRVESRIIGDAGDASESPETTAGGDDAQIQPQSHEQQPGALVRSGRDESEHDQRPEAYVRPGLMQRLFGSGHRVEDPQTGLVHFEQKPGLLRPLARRQFQRDAALSTVRQGLENLSDLMSDIRDGLDASVEKQGELLEHLKYLPIVAEQNARSGERLEEQFLAQNRLQMETIKSIREQSKGQFEQQEALNRVLGTMSKEGRDQKRDVDELQGRLDRMRQSEQSIADNLSIVGNAVRKVSEQGAVQGELVLRMQQAFDERSRQLEESIRQQRRRQGLMIGAALLLAVVAVAAVAVVGYLYLRQTGAV